MKEKHIITYFISLSFLLLVSFSTIAQTDNITETETEAIPDSLKIKKKYGLRVGLDLSKPIRTFFDEDYSGFEIVADYRLTKDLYIAGEFGIEEKTTITDYLDATASGTYFRAGVDYNVYTNWLDMDNMIYGGIRVGASTFKQTRNSFTVYQTNHYWEPYTNTESKEFSGLSALWTEIIIGLKAEMLNNLYMGLNIQFKYMLSQDQPDNFENLYVPGYNRTYDSGRFGFGFGYTIAYRIPLYKKG